jgi:hypothetical protein
MQWREVKLRIDAQLKEKGMDDTIEVGYIDIASIDDLEDVNVDINSNGELEI